MLEITFKEVGQGDSIILEWKDGETYKVGIIDANTKFENGKVINPTLDFIINTNLTQIEFIILTHPHYDHFSGIKSILEYCEEKNIIISHFLHTCQYLPDFISQISNSVVFHKEIRGLIEKMDELDGNIITSTYYVNDLVEIPLNSELRLSFLSPSTTEYTKYMTKTNLMNLKDEEGNPNANWISTLIKVYTKDWYILFTSDCPIEVLKRVGIKKAGLLMPKLILAQIPHHGSSYNHYNGFWKSRKVSEETPVVISVGENSYNHPSKNVVDFFTSDRYNFVLYATNKVGYLDSIKSEIELFTDLYINNLAYALTQPKSTQFQGDQKFIIDNVGNVNKI